MRAPVCYQQGPGAAEPAGGANRSERDEVWERKREAFMRQQQQTAAQPPAPFGDATQAAGMPHSDGYHHGYGGPTPGPFPTALPASEQEAWNAGRYEQQNDPNYAQAKSKTQGYCVLKPPGGGSSLNLGWDTDGTPPARRAGSKAMPDSRPDAAPQYQQPSNAPRGGSYPAPSSGYGQAQDPHEQRQCAPPQFQAPGQGAQHGGHPGQQHGGHPGQQQFQVPAQHAAPTGGHGAAHFNAMHQECINRVNSSPYAWNGEPEPPAHGRGSAPPARNGGSDIGASGAPYATSSNNPSSGGGSGPQPNSQWQTLAHGARQNPESAYRFAVGSSQNVGNCMTGRSTTRVAAPPGGFSSFSLG